MIRRGFFVLLSVLLAAQCAEAQAVAAQARWFRGNTHTHTINSDGDSAPDAVVRWYKEHRYHFLVISDHDAVTPVDGLNAAFAAPGKFLVLSGEEVTDRFEGAPVHLIGVGTRETVPAQGGASIPEILTRDARAIRAAGGVPHVNHPNFGWALTAEQIAASEARHFEIWNGHPLVNNRGGGGSPSAEEIWDKILSTGRVIFGVATDDAHTFRQEYSPALAMAGRGWILVRATELTAAAILAAFDRGDFYCSTGVEFRGYEANEREIRIELPKGTSNTAPRFRTFFIGKDGAVLKQDDSFTPAYQFQGNELYVRARVESSNGAMAWTQPVFPKK
ncbi:MAG: CehA/McbA family metallohydrolase [Acidobacteria bacterium]|nr:CehA/McbA family metallohydrolase [Acidobacteriota bacterium]MCL5287455.1 CehA/McbA family metallohydrolase [Acidobacteriota bacterium]